MKPKAGDEVYRVFVDPDTGPWVDSAFFVKGGKGGFYYEDHDGVHMKRERTREWHLLERDAWARYLECICNGIGAMLCDDELFTALVKQAPDTINRACMVLEKVDRMRCAVAQIHDIDVRAAAVEHPLEYAI